MRCPTPNATWRSVWAYVPVAEARSGTTESVRTAVAVVAVILVFVSLTIGTRSLDITYVYDLVLDHISGATYDRNLQYGLWYDDIIV